MVVGSLADLRLSAAVLHPDSGWGRVLAAIGEWPLGLGRAVVTIIPTVHSGLPTGPLLAGGILFSAAAAVGTRIISSGRPTDHVGRVAAVLIVIIVVELAVVHLAKFGWARPRMRMLEANPDLTFNPWWVLGSPEKVPALGNGIAAEEFRSFPSGHTANAAVAVYLLPAVAWVSQRWHHLVSSAMHAGLAWALFVAASRIVVGAHFLTAVTIGLVITVLTIVITTRLLTPEAPHEPGSVDPRR